MKSFINYRFVLHTLGVTLIFESLFMLLGIPVAAFYGETQGYAVMFESFLVTGIIGVLLSGLYNRKAMHEAKKQESFLIVSLSWLFISLLGTLPYQISGGIPRFVDAFFESVSGFTTTGSSILSDIEALPKYLLFWRALTHWIGGMGIIVLVIAIMPYFKVAGTHLMIAEGSIGGVERLSPRLIETAKRLWFIYIVLTILEIIWLTVLGMDLFDSVCHSFATIATGGFGTKNDSIISYSPAIQYVITLFMFLSGMNFALHYFGFKGKLKQVFQNDEFRAYFWIVIISSLLLTVIILGYYSNDVEMAFRQSIFQVVSIMTCTGFASADYLLWPHNAPGIIFFLMFVGACVGSTGGGIKISRYVIIFRRIRQSFRRIANPACIYTIKYNGKPVEMSIVRSIMTFALIYIGTFTVGTFLMVASGLDFATSSSSIITTLGGIGPGLGLVGPVFNFGGLPVFDKFYLAFNMILGRLEIITVLTIFTPSFYRY